MFAGMAELADAQASGACGSSIVWVQVPFPALTFIEWYLICSDAIFYFYFEKAPTKIKASGGLEEERRNNTEAYITESLATIISLSFLSGG